MRCHRRRPPATALESLPCLPPSPFTFATKKECYAMCSRYAALEMAVPLLSSALPKEALATVLVASHGHHVAEVVNANLVLAVAG